MYIDCFLPEMKKEIMVFFFLNQFTLKAKIGTNVYLFITDVQDTR
jgi:hypothetical protein